MGGTGRRGGGAGGTGAEEAAGAARRARSGPDRLLFLTEEQLRQGIELMFFAYRDFTSDPDAVLAERGYGRAHHRAIHFIKRKPGVTVAGLLEVLRVTKQSLNRVLRQLIEDGLVSSSEGRVDRRQRHLSLTEAGEALERALSEPQRERLRRAFSEAGPEAVAGFRLVLQRMLDDNGREAVMSLVEKETR